MMMRVSATIWKFARRSAQCLLVVACASCQKKDAPAAGRDQAAAPLFDVAIHKAEQKDSVAPNKTYEQQGLGAKPAAGKVFVCVQYEATNKGKDAEYVPGPKLVDAHGIETDVSLAAAGKYLPAGWPAGALEKVAPGATAKLASCFEVAPAIVTTGMKLKLGSTGWGPKNQPWSVSVPLTVSTADAPRNATTAGQRG